MEALHHNIPASWNANLIAFAASWLQPAKLDARSLLMSYQTCGHFLTLLLLFPAGDLAPKERFLNLAMNDLFIQRTSKSIWRAPKHGQRLCNFLSKASSLETYLWWKILVPMSRQRQMRWRKCISQPRLWKRAVTSCCILKRAAESEEMESMEE
jgi:hypothetical protein